MPPRSKREYVEWDGVGAWYWPEERERAAELFRQDPHAARVAHHLKAEFDATLDELRPGLAEDYHRMVENGEFAILTGSDEEEGESEQARERYMLPGEIRPPIGERAGTVLDHRFTDPIKGSARRGVTQHGSLDRRQRLYQGGGELKNFVYWKHKSVTIAQDVWEQIRGNADWIEMLDHQKNEVYRIDMDSAIRLGRTYDAGIGPRWEVPLNAFDRLDAEWYYVTKGER
jgi:hypothetical protein